MANHSVRTRYLTLFYKPFQNKQMFKKFNSIENSYQGAFLEKIKSHGFWNDEYIVQEKVHGANLSYITLDGINFQTAKRTAILQADENFYNFNHILNDIQPKLQSIWSRLKTTYTDMEQMTIFGELFGGDYPKEKVARDKNAKMVQKGIYYSPSNHFFAFDILLNTNTYLDVDEINALFEEAGLLYAKSLFRGSLEDCLQYPNAFDSTIPKELGLPELENNTCEGVVIRPVKSIFLGGGSRVILKNKNEQWEENRRFQKKITKEQEIPEKVRLLQEAIISYITENRLSNVISKIGEITNKDFGKVIGMFNKDVIEDFTKDYGERLSELEKKERKMVTKSIGKHTAKLVRARIRTILQEI